MRVVESTIYNVDEAVDHLLEPEKSWNKKIIMAFKMKNTSMAKLVKEAGNNRIINRMNKLQDKAE